MARPLKQGMDYFPYDVDLDQDDKLAMIIGEYGEKGERLWVKLLGWIYKNGGYFLEWDENAQLKFLRRYNYCGFSLSFVVEVVPRFIKWGLLDKAVFNTSQIMTSKRIQSTWLDATRKRKNRVIDPEIWLIGVIDGLKAEETQKKAEVIDKGKESKENDSKENDSPAEKTPAINQKLLIPILSNIFKKANPSYILQKEKDFEPLQKIAKFICDAEGLTFDLQNPQVIEKIKSNWAIISDFVSKDPFYKTYNLILLEKHIQAIFQKLHHGTTTHKADPKKISTTVDYDGKF